MIRKMFYLRTNYQRQKNEKSNCVAKYLSPQNFTNEIIYHP